MTRPIIIEGPQRRRRLDPSESRPRSLDVVDESNRPVLEWILHALRQTAAKEPIYVGGYHIEKVIELFPGLSVRYHQQRDHEGELGALCCCEPTDEALLLLSASTVLLPGAIERLCTEPGARGIYGGGKTAGVYFLNAQNAGRAFEQARAILSRDPMAGLDTLFSRMSDIADVDLDGLAAPILDQEAVARTIFRGKAQTLDNLAPLIRTASFLPRERVSLTAWQSAPENVLDRIVAAYSGKTVVVRSSASSEDGLQASSAGKYKSVLDVPAHDRAALRQAVNAVVESYSIDGRHPDAKDEVLIQPQLQNLQASGVLLTRDPRSGAPYFVINEDRSSGRSDVVTGGGSGTINQQFVAWSGRRSKDIPAETRRVIDFGNELIELSRLDALDIEYAVSGDGACHLLQVRPLPAARQESVTADDDVLDLIAGAQDFVRERMKPVVGLVGDGTVFGVMPDWNPAEMIGLAPRPLALSLYQMLIGSDAWADARRLLGYRDVRPEALIVSLGGRPYVDVRASLNSFLPESIDDSTAERWVNACLDRLRADPALHDKIEFEIALTCLAPDWQTASARLIEAGIAPDHFANHLRNLTANILNGAVEPLERQLALVEVLAKRREQHLETLNGGLHGQARSIAHHLHDCQRFGLVPFSILARYAFISMSFLRGFLSSNVIDEAQYHEFLRVVPTVAGTIADDLGRDLPIEDLVLRYGHLRPNSYEITSPNYASDPAQFLRPSSRRDAPQSQQPAEEVLRSSKGAIEQALTKLGLDVSFERLTTFMVESIGGRELAKFEFMKSLNAALEVTAELGESIGFDREKLSFLTIDDVLRLATDSLAQADRAQLRRRVAFNEKRWAATRSIRLPDVVREPGEILAFRLEAWRANFVTRKRVAARAVWLDDTTVRPDLGGAIVVIRAADPGYDWIFAHGIAGLVTEYGGVGSHMSIRAAEFGLPAAIGCGAMVMERLRDAQMIELDCASERVRPVA